MREYSSLLYSDPVKQVEVTLEEIGLPIDRKELWRPRSFIVPESSLSSKGNAMGAGD
jgi:hypothetical protein